MHLTQAFTTATILLWMTEATSVKRDLRAGNRNGPKKKKCSFEGKRRGTRKGTAGLAGKVFSDAKIPFGDGLVWSFVQWDVDGNPSRVGLKFTIDDFSTLPTTESDGTWDIRDAGGASVIPLAGHEYIPNLPIFQGPAADKLMFQHVVANYNPKGHGPPGVYDVPHFDMHFYLISNSERTGCVLAPLNTTQCPSVAVTADKCPPEPPLLSVNCDGANYLVEPLPEDMTPSGYAAVCANEPGMGDHLIRLEAPEFNGSPFEHTWIWGRQGGRIHFWEPMVTVAFLERVRAEFGNVGWYNGLVYLGKEVMTAEGNGVEVPISGLTTAAGDPITQANAGLYPTSYRILYSRKTKTFTVDLVGFKGRCKTDTPKKLVCPDFVQSKTGKSKSG